MSAPTSRLLIAYTYFERPAYARNLEFFLRVGLPGVPADADVVLVVNGHECSVAVPERVRVVRRDNEGWDSAAWSAALASVDVQAYSHFVFMNCTVRGPFLPAWARGEAWPSLFLRRLDERVRAVGTTINVADGSVHIQSMLLATDRAGLQVWLDEGLLGSQASFQPNPAGYALDLSHIADAKRVEAIQREIEFSQSLIRRGFNIACMMTAYEGVDFRAGVRPGLSANARDRGDPSFPGGYFGIDLHPWELVFIKTERGLLPQVLDKLSGWMLHGPAGSAGAPALAPPLPTHEALASGKAGGKSKGRADAAGDASVRRIRVRGIEFHVARLAGDPATNVVRATSTDEDTAHWLRALLAEVEDPERIGIASVEFVHGGGMAPVRASGTHVNLGGFAVSSRLFDLGLASRDDLRTLEGVQSLIQICGRRGLRITTALVPRRLRDAAQSRSRDVALHEQAFINVGRLGSRPFSLMRQALASGEVLIDCDFMKPFHNGTFEVVRQLLPGAIMAVREAGFVPVLMIPADAAAFHGIEPGCETITTLVDSPRRFHAALRLAQPWSTEAMREMRTRSMWLYVLYHDLIAQEIGFVDDLLWHQCLLLVDWVFTISDYSARQMVELFPEMAPRVSVARLPVHLPRRLDLPGEIPDGDFHLVMGNVVPHKLLDVTVRHLCNALPGERFVVLADDLPEYPNLISFPYGFTPEPVLEALYTRARSLIQPSLYEGLGLPWIKALAIGRPVHVLRSALVDEVMQHYGLPPDGLKVYDSLDGLVEILRRQDPAGTPDPAGYPAHGPVLVARERQAIDEIRFVLMNPPKVSVFPAF